MDFTEKKYISPQDFTAFVLGADVGGTNTNIGFFGVRNYKPLLLFSLHYKTKSSPIPYPFFKHAISYAKKQDVVPEKACVAVAGVVEGEKITMTNAKWVVEAPKLKKATGIKNLLLINDFVAVAYGINILPKTDLLPLNRAEEQLWKTKVLIGAGTGLGKASLYFDNCFNHYVPIGSEEGHASVSTNSKEEYELIEYLKRKHKKPFITNEDILSGRGLQNLYNFYRPRFKVNNHTKAIDKAKTTEQKSLLISKCRKKDPICKKVFDTFTKFYARYTRDCIISSLPYGGCYIAGGIAANNLDIFTSSIFKKELNTGGKMERVVKKTPLYVVKTYALGLLGSGFAAVRVVKAE